MSLDDLLEGVAPIDDRREFPRLSQPCEETQIVCADGCWLTTRLIYARRRVHAR
jgi:hypothetical protein